MGWRLYDKVSAGLITLTRQSRLACSTFNSSRSTTRSFVLVELHVQAKVLAMTRTLAVAVAAIIPKILSGIYVLTNPPAPPNLGTHA